MKAKFNTFKFFISCVNRLTPSMIGYQLLYSLIRTLEILLVMALPSLLIMLLEGAFSQSQVMIYIGGSLSIIWLFRIFNRILYRKITMIELEFSQLLLMEISLKITTTPFSNIEDAEFIKKKEEALFPINTQNAVGRMFYSLPIVFQSIVVLVSVLTILLVYDPLLTVFACLAPISTFLISRRLIAGEVEDAKDSARANSEYIYYLRKMHDPDIAKDVRIYQMQSLFARKYARLFDVIVLSIKRLYASREYRVLINQGLSTLLMIGAYVLLIIRVMDSALDIALFILLINATLNFNDQMSIFFSEILMFNQQLIYLESLTDFYTLLDDTKQEGDKKLEEAIYSVEFKNVTFRYPKTDCDVLKNCSFRIDGCRNLSIVGRNGSGKTTIIKLLSRLYEPDKGEILVNGVNIRDFDEAAYCDQLSIIFQDFKTFQYSIRENIIFDREVLDDRFNIAIQQAEFEPELTKFPHGVDTNLVREAKDIKAVSLSKGQEQKLVIARSLYKDGSLLVLDEPTASLDPIAEEEVYKHFKSITKDKLAIFISHRLSSCRFSDKIIYLEDGCVIESGNHQELMSYHGQYAKLFELQASKYK